MTTTDPVGNADAVTVGEAPSQVRVAEGSGPEGDWVAWSGRHKGRYCFIAMDAQAFYSISADEESAEGLTRYLRAGIRPGVVMGKGNVIPLDKVNSVQVDEKSGRVWVTYGGLTGITTWDQKGFSRAVLHDLLDELARRFGGAKRWHHSYTPIRASLYPLIAFLFTGGMTTYCWAVTSGYWTRTVSGSRWKSRLFTELAEAVGPIGVIIIGLSLMLGQITWLARAVRNPPIMAGIKPKMTLWKKGKKHAKREEPVN